MAEIIVTMGVSRASYYFSSIGWLFREQIQHDWGIDAQIEIKNEDYATGKLIASQIKSGISYFTEENDDYYILRFVEKHIEYWLNHSLPVFL
tara:strand:+ start:447 stop:722 length:276 start_codon:yes stop_codon:yes gene_type:complete